MPARGGVRWLDRTNGVAIPDSVMLPVSLEESRESLRRPVPSLCHHQDGSGTFRRFSWAKSLGIWT
jgi:hypothetical protein